MEIVEQGTLGTIAVIEATIKLSETDKSTFQNTGI